MPCSGVGARWVYLVRARGWWPGGRCCQGRLSSGDGFGRMPFFFKYREIYPWDNENYCSSRERALLTVSTPHTAKTLAKFVAELRQKVRARWEQWNVFGSGESTGWEETGRILQSQCGQAWALYQGQGWEYWQDESMRAGEQERVKAGGMDAGSGILHQERQLWWASSSVTPSLYERWIN